MAVGEEPAVADAIEAAGEHVQQKAPDQLVGIERHDLCFVAMATILPMKADATVFQAVEAGIGDGDTVGVAPEIV